LRSKSKKRRWYAPPFWKGNLLERRAQEIGIGAAGWRLDGGKDIFRVVEVFAGKCHLILKLAN